MAVSTLIILAVFFAVFLGLAVLDIVMSKTKNTACVLRQRRI